MQDSPHNEFDLIDTYFKNLTSARADVELGIGDDAALVTVPANHSLVITTDTLVPGVHFPVATAPFDIGYKALAVNLSDLAAMGAQPAWISLALTLPAVDTAWLHDFTQGMSQLAKAYQVQLIGGDTTRGALSITLQAFGFVPVHHALRRDGAKAGDKIYVSGTLGDAGLGLRIALQKPDDLQDPAKQIILQRLNRPTPRIELGLLLRGLATSAIDISDGLLADLNHILQKSEVGAHIETKNLPLSPPLQALPSEDAQQLALTAGDDYELCFTVSPEKEPELLEKLTTIQLACHCIGEIQAEQGIRLSGFTGNLTAWGFQHFAEP